MGLWEPMFCLKIGTLLDASLTKHNTENVAAQFVSQQGPQFLPF